MQRLLLSLLLSTIALIRVEAAEVPLIDPGLEQSAAELIATALDSRTGYTIVESLTTEVGPRLAGTEAEERARQWALAKLKELGFANVRVEPFELPVWTRGIEKAEVVAPFPQPLSITALGGSVSTGPDGVEAELVAFNSLAELKQANADHVGGRVVFVNEPTTRTQDGSGYVVGKLKRSEAAFIAEQLGARAVLIRSVGTSKHRFPHTGQMRRLTAAGDAPAGVPAAALSAPDADQLGRILARGESVRVKMTLTPQQRPAGQSGNVIAEIPGRELPEEIVLIGAHLDSWDLGTGAVDDGAGVGIVVGAASLLRQAMPLGPRRTVRIVLFGAEEVGLIGAEAYAEQHKEELAQHVMAAESDFGAGRIWRFDYEVAEHHQDLGAAIARILGPLGIGPGSDKTSGGPDIKYLHEAGVPVVSLEQNGWDYFDLHHTPDDTLDKINPDDIAQNVAAYLALIYLVAEMEQDFRD